MVLVESGVVVGVVEIEGLIGECAFKTKVRNNEMCLHKNESWLWRFASKERVSWLGECVYKTRVMVRGMCFL